jgi:hypothetical protein
VSVVLLSGGTGGAKLARGLYELLGEELVEAARALCAAGPARQQYDAHQSVSGSPVTWRPAWVL